MKATLGALALGASLALLAGGAEAASVTAAPVVPSYGQDVDVALNGTTWPVYLRTTRYTRNGNAFKIGRASCRERV